MGNQWPFFSERAKGERNNVVNISMKSTYLCIFYHLETEQAGLCQVVRQQGQFFAKGTIPAENTIPLEHLGHFITVTAPILLSQMTLQNVGKTEQELKII